MSKIQVVAMDLGETNNWTIGVFVDAKLLLHCNSDFARRVANSLDGGYQTSGEAGRAVGAIYYHAGSASGEVAQHLRRMADIADNNNRAAAMAIKNNWRSTLYSQERVYEQ